MGRMVYMIGASFSTTKSLLLIVLVVKGGIAFEAFTETAKAVAAAVAIASLRPISGGRRHSPHSANSKRKNDENKTFDVIMIVVCFYRRYIADYDNALHRLILRC